MPRRIIDIFCLVVFAVISVTGPALAEQVIKIGVLYPLSGPRAPMGKNLVAGAELAVHIINTLQPELDMPMAKNKGIGSMKGAHIELIVADTGDNTFQAAREATRLIEREGVTGIMGCYVCEQTDAVADICERRGVPMITSCSTAYDLSHEGRRWFWRITPHDGTFVEELFDFLNDVVDGKAPGVPKQKRVDMQMLASACGDNEWGEANSRTIRLIAVRRGFSIGASLIFTRDMPDQLTTARRMKPIRPACVLIAAHENDAVNLFQAMEQISLQPRIIWGQNAGFLSDGFRALGSKVEGVCTRTLFSVTLANRIPLSRQVNFMFRQRTGRDMDDASARAFTGIQTWWYLLQKAGSARPEDINKAAGELNIPGKELIVPWQGIRFGSIIDEPGQNSLGRGLIGQYQIKDGQLRLEIIYPFDLATAKMIFPMPWREK